MKILKIKIWAIAAALLFLHACKVGKDYEGSESSVPQGFRALEQSGSDSVITMNTDSLAIDSARNLVWSDFISDPMLDSLIRRGLEYNQDLLIAAERVMQAQYALGAQRAELLPKFGYSSNISTGNFQFVPTDANSSIFTGFGTVNWELDIWGKYRRLNEAKKAELVSSVEGYRATQISLVSTIAQTYYKLLEYQKRLEISIKTTALRDSMLLIIQERYNKGIVPEIDLNQAQIQRAIAASSVPVFERMVFTSKNTLLILTGVPPADIQVEAKLMDQKMDLDIPAGLPSELLLRRPDLVQAQQAVVSQNAYVGVAHANRFPSISLTGLLGVGTQDLSNITGTFPSWQAAGSLMGPLFYWNQNKNLVEVERSKRTQTVIAYERTVYLAFKEVEDILFSIDALKAEITVREDHVSAAVNAQKLSMQRYDKGVTSYLEFLESQRQAFEAQQNLAGSQQKLLSAQISLYKALGGGWEF
jgi:multidrug efflux system outer membrane protein